MAQWSVNSGDRRRRKTIATSKGVGEAIIISTGIQGT